jgi:hypothetical protein
MAEGPHSPDTGTERRPSPAPPPAAARPVVRLVLKVLYEPAPVTRDAMVTQMRDVYAAAGIDVVVVGAPQNLNLPLLRDVTVGACGLGNPTLQQKRLFANRAGAGPKDICVYFVRSILPRFDGCASRAALASESSQVRGSAIIAPWASKWTLGHECGHVLGLGHVPPTDHLMIGEGTSNLSRDPPYLDPYEIATIMVSPFIQAA